MILLKPMTGKQAGAERAFTRYPVRLGRAADADFRSEAPGVRERHAEIHWESGQGFVLRPQAGAPVSVNGEQVETVVLRNGDQVDLGGLRVQFGLTPLRPANYRVREALTWVGLIGLCLAEAALIYWLPR